MIPCNSQYGSYRTRTFQEIFPSLEEFKEFYVSSPIPSFENAETIDLVYYLLYGRYGNSHIAYSDENQFKYAVLSILFSHGLTWEKKLAIQKDLRTSQIEELTKGSEATYNRALNPNTSPTMDSRQGLTYISEQNKTLYSKSKPEAYLMLLELLETDLCEDFISKFNKLFIQILAYDYPLLYETEI